MSRIFLALLAFLLASPAFAAVRTLVAIGANGGLADEAPLLWAEDDAQRMRDVLVELGGVAPERALLLIGESKSDILVELARVRGQVEETRRRGERAEVFVTFSGHGDKESLHINGERLSFEELSSALALIPADFTLVIVDACRTTSGAPRSGRGRGARRGEAFDVRIVRELAPEGRVTISSASLDEIAQESDDLQGAFFTHHLVAGLRGAADGDRDGRVTLDEVYRYAHARTLAQSYAAPALQHPQLEARTAGEGELTLTQLERARGRVALAADVTGAILVVDARSERVVLEAKKDAGAPLSLAVPPGRLRLLARRGAATGVAEIVVARGASVTVDGSAFTSTTLATVTARGVDPTPWVAGAAVSLAAPTVTPGIPAGGVFHVERRLGPVFIGVRNTIAAAYGTDATRSFHDLAWRGALTIGSELLVGPLRFAGALGGGLHVVGQEVRPLDEDRLARLGLLQVRKGHTLGPHAEAALTLSLVAREPLRVLVGVDGAVSSLRVDAKDRVLPSGSVFCGIGVEL